MMEHRSQSFAEDQIGTRSASLAGSRAKLSHRSGSSMSLVKGRQVICKSGNAFSKSNAKQNTTLRTRNFNDDLSLLRPQSWNEHTGKVESYKRSATPMERIREQIEKIDNLDLKLKDSLLGDTWRGIQAIFFFTAICLLTAGLNAFLIFTRTYLHFSSFVAFGGIAAQMLGIIVISIGNLFFLDRAVKKNKKGFIILWATVCHVGAYLCLPLIGYYGWETLKHPVYRLQAVSIFSFSCYIIQFLVMFTMSYLLFNLQYVLRREEYIANSFNEMDDSIIVKAIQYFADWQKFTEQLSGGASAAAVQQKTKKNSK
ncbi:Oidioi.mRNA.OKI2018_I69.PAR.g9870.t1.cds [Oikopleura dioica]|uniref:Oidioi.mRNA.OKI2018_I69.PAR.g9870.t1.cds n=1 Tax=Oikopleura dioica TaxID=34765 RepID=A0ABN7RMM7_OIKDI|nr:Oidioi.mRNA.OKI2018_I69.PAR.g9870.t1.cds [Oikopleura dioica]